MGSLTGTGDDLDWVTLHADRHFREVQDDTDQSVHWKDAGYWLCWPLAIAALLAVRRGWSVAWTATVLVVAFSVPSADVHAGRLADAFMTADQQGRMAFDKGRYEEAAAHFEDPYWKGRAAYAAGNYALALKEFSTLQTAEAIFYVGNSQTRLRRYDAALAAYDRALELRPGWEPAVVNRGIVTRLLEAMSQEQQGEPAEPPDQTIMDKSAAAGKQVQVPVAKAASEDVWLRNLTISPARFLQGKFAAQDNAAGVTP